MTPGLRRGGAAVGAAAVLALGAYSIGSAAGDGSAEAARESTDANRGPGHRGPDIDRLAERLGVSADDLREALEAVRGSEERRDPRAGLAADLAEALDIPEERVTEALEAQHTAAEQAFAETLAERLDRDADDVRAALEKVRPDEGERRERGGRRTFERALASELDVSVSKLRSALRAARAERGPHGPGDMDALAEALGVSSDRLEAAFEEVRANREARHQERHDVFVRALAERLDISVDKVEEAFPEPRAGGRGGPHPGGPGGPGGFGGPGPR